MVKRWENARKRSESSALLDLGVLWVRVAILTPQLTHIAITHLTHPQKKLSLCPRFDRDT